MKSVSRRAIILALMSILLVGLSLLAGCGDDPVGENSRVVGGPCEGHSDCEERCLVSFPGGMCTLTCESDGDCPGGSACVDVQDGVCLMECQEDRDCPGGYECDDEDRFGASGEVDICEED